MTLAIGLWSLELKPGKEEVVAPQADVRITNIALGDVLSDASGRTTVKFKYRPPSQPDSDDEDEGKNDLASLATAVLCSLKPGTFEQTTTDLVLQEDEEYTFQIVGKNTVYLTGNYIEQQSVNNPPYDMDSDDDMDSDLEDAYDLREVSSDVEMHPDDLLSDASRFETVDEEPSKSLKRAHDADADSESPKQTKSDKKKKLKGEGGKAVSAPEIDQEKKKEKKKEKSKDKEAEKQEPGTGKKAVEREITGGIKILDSKIGTGPMAKKGNKVRMRYIGKLPDGKVFDKNVKGNPYTFDLGKGEVIKGWDEGIVGMQVGGERKLTIPPNMAYGKEAPRGIPKNSTLIFECKLLEIK
ncbi:hypothetical protein L208DRAFT_1432481 [Tricholoma matsutake]|nr:hypothetical protein L208DRAFT_1432481 [Tricholoma matsutake 945]